MNGVHFFGGDFYAFRRAPILITLPAGRNRVDVRLVRDVRSMGGDDISMTLSLDAHIATGTLRVLEDTVILPDLVDGHLPSALGSITVRNEADEFVELCGLGAPEVSSCLT